MTDLRIVEPDTANTTARRQCCATCKFWRYGDRELKQRDEVPENDPDGFTVWPSDYDEWRSTCLRFPHERGKAIDVHGDDWCGEWRLEAYQPKPAEYPPPPEPPAPRLIKEDAPHRKAKAGPQIHLKPLRI